MVNRRKAHRMFLLANVFALILVLAPGAAFAWNPYGHMAVAYVAYQNLDAKTKERASQLLRLNPYYESWKQQIGQTKSQDELDLKIFMLAATWPDAIKGDKSFTADGGMGGFRPGHGADQNTGYNDKKLHMYWHFYDEPFSTDKTMLPKVPAPNAKTQMQAFRSVLASSDAPDELKSYDLTWLIHLVGDIHQPLHSVTRVSNKYRSGDNGGNLVKLSCADCPPNLHSFWDSALGSSGGDPKVLPDPEKVIETASHLTRSKKSSSKNLNVDSWIKESFKLAKESIYKPLGKGKGPFELSEKYRSKAKALAEKQGELAGERLANLLNSELK